MILDEILSALLSKKIKLQSKCIIDITNNLVKISKGNITIIRKSKREKEYYNCHKMVYFASNCRSLI